LFTGPTRGLALGYEQANVVLLDTAHLDAFLRFCERNSAACPVLYVGRPGDPTVGSLAEDADVRTDVPRYIVLRQGRTAETVTDISALWHDRLTSVLLGSSISVDGALARAGVVNLRAWVLATVLRAHASPPFSGPVAVTMRWLTKAELDVANEVTRTLPQCHGAPIHVGAASDLAAPGLPLVGGPLPTQPDTVTAAFWACGVTAQLALRNADLPLAITHAPGHAFVTDRKL